MLMVSGLFFLLCGMEIPGHAMHSVKHSKTNFKNQGGLAIADCVYMHKMGIIHCLCILFGLVYVYLGSSYTDHIEHLIRQVK